MTSTVTPHLEPMFRPTVEPVAKPALADLTQSTILSRRDARKIAGRVRKPSAPKPPTPQQVATVEQLEAAIGRTGYFTRQYGKTGTGSISRERYTYTVVDVAHLRDGAPAYIVQCEGDTYFNEITVPATDITLIEDAANHHFIADDDNRCTACGRTARHSNHAAYAA